MQARTAFTTFCAAFVSRRSLHLNLPVHEPPGQLRQNPQLESSLLHWRCLPPKLYRCTQLTSPLPRLRPLRLWRALEDASPVAAFPPGSQGLRGTASTVGPTARALSRPRGKEGIACGLGDMVPSSTAHLERQGRRLRRRVHRAASGQRLHRPRPAPLGLLQSYENSAPLARYSRRKCGKSRPPPSKGGGPSGSPACARAR